MYERPILESSYTAEAVLVYENDREGPVRGEKSLSFSSPASTLPASPSSTGNSTVWSLAKKTLLLTCCAETPSEPEKCRSLLERFVFSLKYMHTLEDKPEVFEDDLLNRLYTATELSSMTVTTRQNYDKIMHNELDRLAENAFAREQGFAEGEAKGKADEKADIAKAMLADKVNPSVIAKYTGLSEEEIQKLAM